MIAGVAQNGGSQAFHGDPELVRFACSWAEQKQTLPGHDGLAEKLGNGWVVSALGQFPVAIAGRLHVSLYVALFLARLAV